MRITLIHKEYQKTLINATLALLVLIVATTSLATGAVSIPLKDVVSILLKSVGISLNHKVDDMHEVVLTTIRLPRIVMTVLIGASLGISGATLQGLFRNPLVEPSLIGVSGGAAVAVIITIVFNTTLFANLPVWSHHITLSLAAFTGGCIATMLVVLLSMYEGRSNVAVLILVGVAVNALTGAIIGLIIFNANENQLATFTFWTLGDLGGATWDKLAFAAPLLLFSIICLLFFGQSLNALALGEADAYYLGVNVEFTKRICIVLSALAIGISVSLAGIIGFVGLIVPHLVRTVFHSDNTLVLPASALGGAMILIIADIFARTIVSPSQLPIGVVTALLGSPFFIVLLLKAKRQLL